MFELISNNNTRLITDGTYSSGRKKQSPEYAAWAKMKDRCINHRNPEYFRYGGRGITICDEWKTSFDNFLNYIGSRPTSEYSLDRINNNEGYKPGNVRWATQLEQVNNRSNNVFVSYNGRKELLKTISDRLGLDYSTVRKRYKKGYPLEQVFSVEKYVVQKNYGKKVNL